MVIASVHMVCLFVVSFKDNTSMAKITTLTCNSAAQTGTLSNGSAEFTISIVVPYSVNNSGVQCGQSVSSTGVTGLTANLATGVISISGNFTYIISGTPTSSGTASFAINECEQSCIGTALVTDKIINGTEAVSSLTFSAALAGNLKVAIVVVYLCFEYHVELYDSNGIPNTIRYTHLVFEYKSKYLFQSLNSTGV